VNTNLSNKDTLIAATSLVVSLAALIVSFNSCRQTDQSLEIASNQVRAGRLIAWEARFDSGYFYINPVSLNSSVDLQSIYVYFPRELSEHAFELNTSNPRINLNIINRNLNRSIWSSIPGSLSSIDRDFYHNREFLIPIVIDSRYIINGDLEFLHSEYLILSRVSSIDNGIPRFEFCDDCLYLFRHIDNDVNVAQIRDRVDFMWGVIKSMYWDVPGSNSP